MVCVAWRLPGIVVGVSVLSAADRELVELVSARLDGGVVSVAEFASVCERLQRGRDVKDVFSQPLLAHELVRLGCQPDNGMFVACLAEHARSRIVSWSAKAYAGSVCGEDRTDDVDVLVRLADPAHRLLLDAIEKRCVVVLARGATRFRDVADGDLKPSEAAACVLDVVETVCSAGATELFIALLDSRPCGLNVRELAGLVCSLAT